MASIGCVVRMASLLYGYIASVLYSNFVGLVFPAYMSFKTIEHESAPAHSSPSPEHAAFVDIHDEDEHIHWCRHLF